MAMLFVFGGLIAVAQTTQITGTVTDAITNEPIPGASVYVKGNPTTGTVTNIEGKFSLNVNSTDKMLVVSFVGYATREVPIVGTVFNVALETATEDIEEVVVIGYGTQRKGDVTSSVASVKSENFTQGAVRDAGELIKGKVAGLIVSNSSGDPTAGSSINLRGTISLMGGQSPLILINGIEGDMNTVAPEDIQSIDVLKDASAAAIYGTRGANGVILITTKSVNRKTPVTVTYSPYIAFSHFVRKMDFLTASDMKEVLALGWKLPFKDLGYDTDWLKEISRTGVTQNHNIGISGGSEKSNYVVNIGYNNIEGVFKKSNNERLKVSFDMNQYMFDDKLKININMIRGKQEYNALGDGYSIDTRIYRNALIRNPTDRPKDDAGNWIEDATRFQYYNPVAWIEETDGVNKEEWTRLTSNITLTPIAGWETNLMLSNNKWDQFRGFYQSKKHWTSVLDGKNGYASRGDAQSITNNLELTSKYTKSIGEHRFSAMAGYSYQYDTYESGYANNYDFPTDAYSYYNISVGNALKKGNAGMGSSRSMSRLIGFFGRATYGFGNRYNILASIRREGSSRFGKNNKWATFPSVSAGWIISNEEFMKDIPIINNLKLRAGYGITGIISGSSYQSLTLMNYSSPFYYNGEWIKELKATINPNPNLRWEKSAETSFGVDFALLDSRISGSIDLYKKSTSDMLWNYTVPVPPNLYNNVTANVGKMENKGIEILINTIPVKMSSFEWNSSFTFSHNKNKLVSLTDDVYKLDSEYLNWGGIGDPISMATHRLEVGKSVGNFWGLKSVDITTGNEDPALNGIWIIEKADGTRHTLDPSMYTDEYRQYLGNGIPKYNLSWTNSLRYKGFDMSMVINSALGFQILNHQRMFYENKNIAYNRLKSAYWLAYGKEVPNYYQQTYVSYYIEDGDYVKLDNVTLGYTFNTVKVKYVKSLRLYASCSNLITLTKYKGIDPELSNYDLKAAGNDDRDKYPSLRTFTFGLNATF